tara:strand:+ start:2505 stop:3353 length:849 start_codon:yes stop_codon:yes gene_type:complete
VKRPGAWLALAFAITIAISLVLVGLDLAGIRNWLPLTLHYDWLAFIGAILGGAVGGFITFGGVYLTLRQQRESDEMRTAAEKDSIQRRAEAEHLRNRLSFMPLFEYRVSYDPKDFDNSSGQLSSEPGWPIYELDGADHDDPDSIEFFYDLVITNVGLGHAFLAEVTLDVRDNQDNPVQTFQSGFTNFLVKAGSRRDARYVFYAPRVAPPRFDDPRQYVYGILVTLKYRDLLGNEYQQVLRTSIAKGLYADENETSSGSPHSSFHFAEPPAYLGGADPGVGVP